MLRQPGRGNKLRGTSGNFCGPTFRLQQHSLMRAHRHANELLESPEEENCLQQHQRLLHLKCAASAMDGDRGLPALPDSQQRQQQQQQQQQATSHKRHIRHQHQASRDQPADLAHCRPGGGDDRDQPASKANRCTKLTATETSAEVLRHMPCPCPRDPKPASGTRSSSSAMVTDSLITSLDDCADSEDDADPCRGEDSEEAATCSGTGTESLPPVAKQRHCCISSQTTIAIQLLKSQQATGDQKSGGTAMMPRLALTKATYTRPLTAATNSSKSPPSVTVEQPRPQPQIPQFHLSAAMWAAAAEPAEKQQQQQQQQQQQEQVASIPRLSAPQQQPPPQKKPPLERLQECLQAQHCPTFSHHRLKPATVAAAVAAIVTVADPATAEPKTASTASATATDTPPPGQQLAMTNSTSSSHQALVMPCGAADATARPPPPQSPKLKQMSQRHQHRHQRCLRRHQCREASARYLPCDSFSASTEQRQSTKQRLRPQPLKRCQPQGLTACQTQPAAAAVAWTDPRQLNESGCGDLASCLAGVSAQSASPARIRGFSVVSADVASCSASALLVRPAEPNWVSLALIVACPVRERSAPLPPRPRLAIRQLRQRATLCVQQQRRESHDYCGCAEPQAALMKLRHHRSDSCLLERLSVTARLRRLDDNDGPPSGRSSVALMSRLFYPEDLRLVTALPILEAPADSDDCRSSSSSGSSSRSSAEGRQTRRRSKVAAWSIVSEPATDRARTIPAAPVGRARGFQLSEDVDSDWDSDAFYDEDDDCDEEESGEEVGGEFDCTSSEF